MKTFNIKELRTEIENQYGSVEKLKNYLKENAIEQYGCEFSEIEIYNCKISYTSNPNCFASFLIIIPHVGMTSSHALGRDSFTSAGLKRLGSNLSNHYIKI